MASCRHCQITFVQLRLLPNGDCAAACYGLVVVSDDPDWLVVELLLSVPADPAASLAPVSDLLPVLLLSLDVLESAEEPELPDDPVEASVPLAAAPGVD